MLENSLQGLPISPQQRRLWRLCPRAPFHPYRSACAVEIAGDLDAGALQAALERVARRHEILRTSFHALPGMPYPLQVIGDALPVLARDGEAPQGGDSPLQAVLESRGPDRHLLRLELPALCADGASLDNLVAEIAHAYAGREQGEAFQYADVAAWNDEILGLEEAVEGKSFWRRAGLSGAPAVSLHFSHQGSGTELDPRTVPVLLPADAAARLEAAARHCGAEPEAVLLAAWEFLLGRLADRPDFLIGVVRGGRKYAEMVEAIGPYARCLPLPSEPEAGSLAARARRISAALREIDSRQEYFDWDLAADGAGDRALPFAFELSEVPPPAAGGGLTFTLAGRDSWGERFEAMLRVRRRGGELSASLAYDAGLLSREDAERLAGWYSTLLLNALTAPESAAGDLEILGGDERRRVLEEWNATAADLGPARTLWDWIAERAARDPGGIALEWEGGEMTRAELTDRALRLAGHLRRLGVGSGTRVGVAVERSPEMVLGLLGVLAAGGAYVPLDPDYPHERLEAMLADAGAAVLLTRESLAGRFAEGPFRLVLLDRDRALIEAGEPAGTESGALPDDLAYVIYTSGSTGRPKGVMTSHRAILNRLLWMQRTFPLAEDDRLLQKTPYSFDASVWEIFVPLIAGARLLLAEPGGQRDNAYLLQTVARREVTVLQLVPSQLAVFLEQAGVPEGCAGLRRLYCGGEALPAETVRRWLDGAGVPLCNLYGPTEVSIDATFHPCDGGQREGIVPIGRPLANLRVYLVDRRGLPVPAGLPGELLVGGPSLARGYLGRPDLSAERFVPDPFGPPGERLYRTGDLARALPDGTFEYLGRIDQQVKIRGVRIEPGEIEAALLHCPGVAEAAVAVRGESAADRRLVAYVAAAPGAEPLDGAAVAARLRELLPEPMQPADLVTLPALPRLPSGKLDRRGLPDPTPADRRRRGGFVAPRTSTERRLAEIWAELLQLEPIGAHDHFFDAGGHSLLATQLASRIRETFQVEIKVRQLFEEPVLAALAGRIEELERGGRGVELPPIVPTPREGEIPLSFAQQRLWFLDQLDPGSPAYNIPAAVRLRGEVSAPELARIFAEVVRRHEALRTTFGAPEGRPAQVVAPAGASRPAVPVVDLAGLPEAGREALALGLALDEARRPFDLERGPLLRLRLVRLEERDHLLLMTMHHIVSDGWSTGVLVREIAALHAAFAAGEPSPLPELAVQYADFARWQRDWMRGEALESQLAYWRGQLAGAPQALELPTDRPRPAVQTSRGASRPVALPPALSEAVREICAREGATPFMALLAAWSVALGRAAGQEDLLVGSPVAGRNRREIEDLIGCFINTLALRSDLSGAPGFTEVLARTRRTALDAYAHQDLPFERIVEELIPERDLSRSPLFQALFALQNAPLRALSIPGLELSPVAMDSQVVKLDLALSLWEGPEGFLGVLEHNADLFDAATAERLWSRFEVLLEGLLREPGQAVTDVPALPAAEVRQALLEAGGTRSPYPREASVPAVFAAVVVAAPEAPAMVDATGEVWSYRRLDETSDRLARHLGTLGIGAGARVGVAMTRSADLLVALLAILKAGAAYVPLDPAYPDERLAYLMTDAGVEAVLAHAPTRERLASLEVPRLISLEEALAAGPSGGAAPPLPPVPAEALAYVVYTSGSTGRPKGVAVPHRGILRLVLEANYLALGPDDRLAFNANTSFDAATFEIWGTLLNGGTLVAIPQDLLLSPQDLAAALRRERVTVLHLTTALFNRVAQEAPEILPPLRCALFGGEASDPGAIARILQGALPRRLLHMYGPTESTTFATWHEVTELAPGAATVPIGRPVSNTTAHVLDRWGGTAPLDQAGELYLGGDGLAWGYLNRPDLTAEWFVPDPWSDAPGGRLYRTGDLVGRRAGGALEFQGRIDQQVKIRGYRIEPGEIEAVLAGRPGVAACAVLARRDGPGDARLVAYVVPAPEAGLTEGTLREDLKRALPDYMLPSALVFLEALPLTPNGKVDRRALPAPGQGRPDLAGEYVAPEGPIAETLAAIWAEALGLDRVGARDNFFDLGGHSLLATQVAAQIWKRLDVRLPLRELFLHPTVESLAGRLEREMLAKVSDDRLDDLLARLEAMDEEEEAVESLNPGADG